MIRRLVGVIGISLLASHALAADPVEIGIGYLGQAGIKSKLSLVEQPSENDGIAGARLAIEDNNTTGKFLGQRFALEERRIREGEDPVQAALLIVRSLAPPAGRKRCQRFPTRRCLATLQELQAFVTPASLSR